MPTGALPDPLYHLARQHLLFSGDTRISSLQRWLRIGYEHARALREALRGDALDYHADTDTWHIHPNADRQTDYLLADKLQRAAHLLQGSSALMIATGEGMAADSGLPDLRDAATFSHTWPAVAREGLGFEKMTSPQAFDEHPATAWGMYGQLLNLCRAKEPHAGYTLLRQWVSACRTAASCSPATPTGTFTKPVSRPPASTNASAPSTGCNAQRPAVPTHGRPATCTHRWTAPPWSGKASCLTAPTAARWHGPTC